MSRQGPAWQQEGTAQRPRIYLSGPVIVPKLDSCETGFVALAATTTPSVPESQWDSLPEATKVHGPKSGPRHVLATVLPPESAYDPLPVKNTIAPPGTGSDGPDIRTMPPTLEASSSPEAEKTEQTNNASSSDTAAVAGEAPPFESGQAGWKSYISILHSTAPAVNHAIILGYPAADVWAESENPTCTVTETELLALAKLFDNITSAPKLGADLNGSHYFVVESHENLIFGKKGWGGFFAAKTRTAILLAIYTSDKPDGTTLVRTIVKNLAVYLRNLGY